MRDSQRHRLQRCIDYLRPIQAEYAETVSEVHWIGASNADPDQAPSYCRSCCDKHVSKLNEQTPEHDYFCDGGWGYEADGQEICADCGAILNCTLTHYGVSSELDNWGAAKISLRGKHRSSTAFALLLILESTYLDDYWLSAPRMQLHEADRILAIHRDANALTRRIDRMRQRATPPQQKESQ